MTEARTGRTLDEPPPEAPPSYQPGTAPPEGSGDAETVAKAEEAVVAAAMIALPKGASAEERANAVGSRPGGLDAPREGRGDDLKRIRGIGPANERKLNGLGIHHYDQIAAWGRAKSAGSAPILGFRAGSTASAGSSRRRRWPGRADGGATMAEVSNELALRGPEGLRTIVCRVSGEWPAGDEDGSFRRSEGTCSRRRTDMSEPLRHLRPPGASPRPDPSVASTSSTSPPD